MNGFLSERFDDALTYASTLHRTQRRKGTDIPYVSHLLAVTGLVLEAGGDEDEAIAALLHDGAEDQGGLSTLRAIRERFGDRVGEIVAECSDTFEEKKPAWKERKEAYIAHLAETSPSGLLVSCADKLHNARAILTDYRALGDDLWSRFNAGQDEILWYYRALVDRYGTLSAPARLVAELDRVVGTLEALAGARPGDLQA